VVTTRTLSVLREVLLEVLRMEVLRDVLLVELTLSIITRFTSV